MATSHSLGDVEGSSFTSVGSVTTIRHLVDALGSPYLHVLAAPRGLDHRVSGTVLHDPVDTLREEPDAMLLVAGLRADGPGAVELVEQAHRLGYCAMVVKRRGDEVSALVTEASQRGIAILAAADEVSWRHLDALLLSVLASQGVGAETASGSGDELFALANSIASVIGGSVAIEDLDRRVVAYSTLLHQRIDHLREQGILDRHVPELDRHAAQYRAVLADTEVVRFAENDDEFARAAIAIQAGGRPLGTIWAIERTEGLSEAGTVALAEGARLAALTMLRSLNASGRDVQLRESALLLALDGALSGSEVSFRLGLPGGANLALIGFAVHSDRPESVPLITHVASAVARYVAAYRPDAAMATTSRAVYVLLAGGTESTASRFAAGALGATVASFPNQVRVAVADESSDPSAIGAMRLAVDDILRVTTTQPDLAVIARMVDVHTRVLLSHIADELRHEPRLRHSGVIAMAAHDVANHTDYCRSLTAWLDAFGDVGVASQRLAVHPNTLRHRLRRVSELFSISVEHPDDRLAVWIQLRAGV